MTNDRANHTVPDPLLRRAARDADGPGLSSSCLEPDVLAAWADGALSAPEVHALETHAAACGRCRTLLAAMVQSEPPRTPAHAWWKVPVLRWAAPLAAVAGGLLLWVAIDRQPNRALDSPAQSAPPATVAESKAVPEAVAAVRAETDALKAAPQAQAKAKDAAAPPATEQAAAARTRPSGTLTDSVEARRSGQSAAAPAPPASPAPTEPSRFAAKAMAIDATVISPDSSSRWRIGPPGTIERSTDGGRTWNAQPVDTNTRLVAGVSPASSTCWVVGAAGTVLRTTDGRTWQRLSAPDPADLVAVTAKDADTATVTTADGRSFTTTDGGLTWSR